MLVQYSLDKKTPKYIAVGEGIYNAFRCKAQYNSAPYNHNGNEDVGRPVKYV